MITAPTCKHFSKSKLRQEEVRTVSTTLAGVNGITAAVKMDETDKQDKEEKMHAGSSVGNASMPLTDSAKRNLRQRAAKKAKAKARTATDAAAPSA